MINRFDITVLDGNDNYRRFLKIIIFKSGGFAIILPRFKSKEVGRLEKTKVKYLNHGTHLDIKRDKSEQYSAKDIVKFSYHPDGFVQFSSTTNNRIVSGRNKDGTPKGLGLISWPLNNPVSTGPSMTITFWGLSELEIQPARNINKSFIFETKEATPHPKAVFEKKHKLAYAMAFYIIPNSVKGKVTTKDGKKFAHLSMMQRLPGGRSFLRLRELVRLLDVPSQDFRIAISWFNFPKKAKSKYGYVFMGPTDGKSGLAASYPAGNFGNKLLMKDLAYK